MISRIIPKFIDEVKELIKREIRSFIVDGIKYQKIGDDHYYAQELFESEELIGYLNKNMIKTKKSAYDHVVYDSNIESDFAQSFEKKEEVKVYVKNYPHGSKMIPHLDHITQTGLFYSNLMVKKNCTSL